MNKFSHLEELDVKPTDTAEYKIHNFVGMTPTLVLAPAIEANEGYFNALLRRGYEQQRQVQAGGINTSLISSNRNEDKELYALFIIKGWVNMKDSKGKEVKFSVDECKDFLAAIPDDIFDGIREYATKPHHFRVDKPLDTEPVSKN